MIFLFNPNCVHDRKRFIILLILKQTNNNYNNNNSNNNKNPSCLLSIIVSNKKRSYGFSFFLSWMNSKVRRPTSGNGGCTPRPFHVPSTSSKLLESVNKDEHDPRQSIYLIIYYPFPDPAYLTNRLQATIEIPNFFPFTNRRIPFCQFLRVFLISFFHHSALVCLFVFVCLFVCFFCFLSLL